MSTRDMNIRLIGGNSPLLIATVKEVGKPVTPQKNYGLEMYIARHGKGLDDRPKGGYIAKFYYDRSIRRLRTVIPKKQSLEMIGHYAYHYGVTTPTNTEYRPEYGVINFIQGFERG